MCARDFVGVRSGASGGWGSGGGSGVNGRSLVGGGTVAGIGRKADQGRIAKRGKYFQLELFEIERLLHRFGLRGLSRGNF